jgi:hypothetical protein
VQFVTDGGSTCFIGGRCIVCQHNGRSFVIDILRMFAWNVLSLGGVLAFTSVVPYAAVLAGPTQEVAWSRTVVLGHFDCL